MKKFKFYEFMKECTSIFFLGCGSVESMLGSSSKSELQILGGLSGPRTVRVSGTAETE